MRLVADDRDDLHRRLPLQPREKSLQRRIRDERIHLLDVVDPIRLSHQLGRLHRTHVRTRREQIDRRHHATETLDRASHLVAARRGQRALAVVAPAGRELVTVLRDRVPDDEQLHA
jgi:hypothetical protein